MHCGHCVKSVPEDVHRRPDGYRHVIRPLDYRCIGPDCRQTGHYCIDACPQQALSMTEIRSFETLGDYRWTPDLLASNWHMAETGALPGPHLESEDGAFGRRFRQAAHPLSRRATQGPAPRRHLHPTGLQPAGRLAGEGRHRRALVRRRHVVRLDQHPRPVGQGPRGQGLQQASPAPARAAIRNASSPTRTMS